jgi:integrase
VDAPAGECTRRVRLHPLVREQAQEEWARQWEDVRRAAVAELLTGVNQWVAQHQQDFDLLARDVVNEVRRSLQRFLAEQTAWQATHDDHPGAMTGSEEHAFVFTSQRSARLTERGIHHWLQRLHERATKAAWVPVGDVTYHDLRHDFAHRAREAGWTLEEVAYYLGHVTKKGTPAIKTTVRYTQVSREQIRAKLPLLRG